MGRGPRKGEENGEEGREGERRIGEGWGKWNGKEGKGLPPNENPIATALERDLLLHVSAIAEFLVVVFYGFIKP